MKIRASSSILLLFIIYSFIPFAACETTEPATVEVGAWVMSVEKVDLAESMYRIDFFLVFYYDPSEINAEEMKEFEFINGDPSVNEIVHDELQGYLAYRVRGDFITSFDLGNYPFDSHRIVMELEHRYMTTSELILSADAFVDDEMIIVGWDYRGIESNVMEHSYHEEESYSRVVFAIRIQRPLLSSFFKNVLPIVVIAAISMLTFLISASRPSERIALGVSTLLSATAFHLSLLGSIPPTGVFTIADGIMLSVYFVHFYSLSISVYLMRLIDVEEKKRAEEFNKRAIKFLPVIIVVPIALAILFNL